MYSRYVRVVLRQGGAKATARRHRCCQPAAIVSRCFSSTTSPTYEKQQQQSQSSSSSLTHNKQQRRFKASLALDYDDHPDDDEEYGYEYDYNTSTNNNDSPYSKGPLHDKYFAMVQEAGGVQVDPIQLKSLETLERLRADLMTTPPPPPPGAALTTTASSTPKESTTSSSSSSGWGWFSSPAPPAKQEAACPDLHKIQGVYLHGGVGCGKTFLMNQIFFDSIQDTLWAGEAQKTHFHKFLLQVHAEMHAARNIVNEKGIHVSDAILPHVIQNTVQHGRLLCFDEFQVTDVADALILKRLFEGLWQAGCVLVATSNRPPQDLYKDGLQRDRFVPFIDLLQQKCEVVSMWESETDYRLVQKAESGANTAKVYFHPQEFKNVDNPNKHAKAQFDTLFYDMVGRSPVAPTALTTQGRNVAIPQAAISKGIARFTFEDLCQKALGAADYLVIGQTFHTVFVENIPQLTLAQLNWVRRFITFIDSMYESNVKLILHAQTPAGNIFKPNGDNTGAAVVGNKHKHVTDDADLLQHTDEVFAFDRTVSRLDEMSSQTYLQKQHKRWCGNSVSDITKPPQQMSNQHQQEHSSKNKVEPKASLISKRKAVVNIASS